MLTSNDHPVLGTARTARIAPELANTDWNVGDACSRWDVSFTDRLMHTVRRLFSRSAPVRLNDPSVFVPIEKESREAA